MTTTDQNVDQEAMPELKLPSFKFSDGASVTNQLNKLNSIDSVGMQQAKVMANERGVPSGAIHSSQQAGAAQRALLDINTPLAGAEASKQASEDINNWTNNTKSILDTYDKQYAERIDKLGYNTQQKIAMSSYASSLSNTLMSGLTSLINNTDLNLTPESIAKLTDVYNNALDNNNLILDMGFTY